MRLLSLELQGFKSFPDKTVIRFDRGVTVIVGPNGSGKSNISDAIRWVLGEISSKNIRGTKMEDVIFGGTDKRSPMGFAEVSLTIDNRDADNKLPLDYDEVTITRRYYRSGESEYMINRSAVRLKDITEMFMNTGLGRSGYSMINQGKSAEIISQKSDERRNIFEEAAGISKYRYKKNEAERKLAEVEEHLIRLTDILRELTDRVGPLGKEAERAKRYLELFERKKEADVSLWLYDLSSVKARLAEMEKNYQIAKHEYDIAEDTLQDLEKQSEKLFLEKQENSRRVEQLAREIEDARTERFELDGNSRVLQNDMQHLETQIKEAEDSIRIHNASLADTKSRGEKEAETLATQNAALEALKQSRSTAEQERNALEEAVRRAGDEIDENYQKIQTLQAELTDIKVRFSALEAASDSTREHKDALEAERVQYQQTLTQMQERMKQAEVSLADYRTRQAELNGQLQAIDEKSARLSEQRERKIHAQTQYHIDITAGKQRLDSLKRMEEHFEGYAQSVRAIMQASESGRLSGIFAPISKLISVDARFSLAIETALGANLQNIVVKDESAAKAAITFLKTNNAGRSTFYPLTSVRGQALREAEFSHYAGLLGVASTLVQYDGKFTPVMESLLGKTLVFDNLDHATDMAKANGYRTRIVTLDGQIINAGGSFTGGSAKRDTGMLTRGAERERMEKEIAKWESEKAQCDAEISAMSAEFEQLKSDRAKLSSKAGLLSSMMQAEDTQYQILKTQYESDQTRAQALTEEISRSEKAGDAYQAEFAQLTAREQQIGVELESAKADSANCSAKEEAKRKEFDAKQDALSHMILQIALAEKDLETTATALQTLQNTVLALEEQIQREQRVKEQAAQKLERARSTISANTTVSSDMDEKIKTLQQQRAALIADGEQFEKRESDIKAMQKDRSDHRDRLFRDYTKLESQKQAINEEQDKMTARMWEEYNLTFSTAAELHYPPVTQETKNTVTQVLTECKNKLRALGSVNVNAIEEYKEVKERYDFLNAQVTDLNTSKEEFSSTVTRLEKEMRTRFLDVMAQINTNFQTVFAELFGGGHAELILSEPENVLESGIEINVAPPGKIIKKLSLLSGGEQSFVAIALLFAILNVNPTPFCVLDEVEAALDEVNVDRVAEYAKRYSQTTQLIFITHRRGTMEAADMLYGVTMAERGISKVLSLNINEVEGKLGLAGISR